MKKKIVITVFFTLSVMNTIAAGFWILGIEQNKEFLNWRYESTLKLNSSLYDNSSLMQGISKLGEKISKVKSIKRKDGESLEMTEDILDLFEQNGIKVISYRLEGEDNREELDLTAEGDVGSVLKLIYELSFSKEGFCINFVSIDARFSERQVTLVIRITYA